MDKSMTKAVKGIAICLMLYHHFFAFPDWLSTGISYWDLPYVTVVAVFGKICVAIYTLLSGYGLYASYRYTTWKEEYIRIVQRCFWVLLNWWLVVIFLQIPVEILVGTPMSAEQVIQYLVLQNLGDSPFVGYLRFYLIYLVSLPIIVRIIRQTQRDWIICFVMPFASILIRKLPFLQMDSFEWLYTYILYIPYALIGAYLYKQDVFERIKNALQKKKCSWLIYAGLIVMTLIVRSLLGGRALSFDSWISAVFVIGCVGLLSKSSIVIKGFAKLGAYSTNLWYIHALLIFPGQGALQKILYMPQSPFLILIWGIILCLPGSFLINFINRICEGVVSKKKSRISP